RDGLIQTVSQKSRIVAIARPVAVRIIADSFGRECRRVSMSFDDPELFRVVLTVEVVISRLEPYGCGSTQCAPRYPAGCPARSFYDITPRVVTHAVQYDGVLEATSIFPRTCAAATADAGPDLAIAANLRFFRPAFRIGPAIGYALRTLHGGGRRE